jgi:hypothetical protein
MLMYAKILFFYIAIAQSLYYTENIKTSRRANFVCLLVENSQTTSVPKAPLK